MSEESSRQGNIELKKDDVEILRDDVLGRGGYGVVYRGYFRNSGQTVAIKLLIAEGTLPKRNVRDLQREAKRLKQLSDHPSILNMHGILMESGCYGLVLEYMHFGSSGHFVKDFQVDMALLLRIAKQVIEAMAYLHAHNPPMLHLDLKADNILINNYIDAKICDFGLSEWKTVTTNVTGMGRRCTITHIAPEVFDNINAPNKKELDIYAFGITLWELFTSKDVYSGRAENLVRDSVLNNQRPELGDMPPHTIHIQQIMTRCWQQDQQKRPQFSDLKNDIQPLYKMYEKRLPVALKSIRKQICENYAVNDEEYIHTEFIENIKLDPLEQSDVHFTTVLPVQPEMTMEMDQPESLPALSFQTPLVEPIPGRDSAPIGIPEHVRVPVPVMVPAPVPVPIPVVGHQTSDAVTLHLHTDYKQYPERELKNGIYNSLTMDPIRKNNVLRPETEDKPLANLLLDTRKIQEMVNNNSLLRSELMRSNSPVFSTMLHQKSRHSSFQAKLWQKYGRQEDSQKHYSYTRHQNPSDMSPDDQRRYEKSMNLRSCSYGRKLRSNGVEEKLIQALKEPYYLAAALKQPDPKPGKPRPFSLVDQKVKDLAQDPMILQIVLSQEPEILDNLMRRYPEMVMKLLANGKTEYRPPNQRQQARTVTIFSRRSENRQGHRAGSNQENPPYSRNPMNLRMFSMMEGNREDRQAIEMMNRIVADRLRLENKERENQEREKHDKEKQTHDEKGRIFQMFKVDQTNRKSKPKETKKITKVAMEGAGKATLAKHLIETDIQNKKDLHPWKLDTALPSFGASSITSMDQLSMEEGASSQPSPPNHSEDSASEQDVPVVIDQRQGASALPPTPIQPQVKQEPTEMQPTASQGARGDNTKAEVKEEVMDVDANPESPDQKPDTGHVGTRSPVTIYHEHAGGGRTNITFTGFDIPPNLQVGNRNVMVVQGAGGVLEEPARIKKPGKQKKLDMSRFPETLMNMDQIDTVATEIGNDWKKLCRDLGLTEAELDQLHHDYYINGLYEVVYQGIQRWLQKMARAATVRVMAKSLCKVGRDDVALLLI